MRFRGGDGRCRYDGEDGGSEHGCSDRDCAEFQQLRFPSSWTRTRRTYEAQVNTSGQHDQHESPIVRTTVVARLNLTIR